jgi:hypothetical protein
MNGGGGVAAGINGIGAPANGMLSNWSEHAVAGDGGWPLRFPAVAEMGDRDLGAAGGQLGGRAAAQPQAAESSRGAAPSAAVMPEPFKDTPAHRYFALNAPGRQVQTSVGLPGSGRAGKLDAEVPDAPRVADTGTRPLSPTGFT